MIGLIKTIFRSVMFFLPDQVISSIYFEFSAFIGKLLSRPLVLDQNSRNFINLGSGPNIDKSGCINIDFFTTPGIDYGADIRCPLKIADSSIDGIFSEHTFEHLTYDEVDRLLSECYRIMKPHGVIRIILPDISLFISHYCEQDSAWFRQWEQLLFIQSDDRERAKRRLASPLHAISFVTQEYGHISSWDIPTISFYLEKNGFRAITPVSFRQGQCPQLLIDQNDDGRKFVSLYVEAMK